MPKVPHHWRFDNRVSGLLAKLPWGMVWGAFAGLVIGMGVNLNIGFFYDRSSAMAMYAVAAVCSVLGGFLGYVISSLYSENVMLMGHDANGFRHVNSVSLPMATQLPPLKSEVKHRVIGSHASIGAVHAPRADYPADEIDMMLRHLVAQAGGHEASVQSLKSA